MADLPIPIKEDDLKKIDDEAKKVVAKISNSGTDIENELEKLTTLGELTQQSAGEHLEMLKRPLKDLMGNKNAEISNTLLKLRSCVDEISPDNFFKKGGIGNLFHKMFGSNPITNYIRKYESIEIQIENIVEALRNGRDKIEQDSIELTQIKASSKEKIYELEKRICLGKKLIKMLELEAKKPEQELNKPILEKAEQKVITRVRNMETMVNILLQSIASIDVIKENNDKLKEAIFNAITMTQNVVTVSASIQMGLVTQKKVIDAVKGVNEATEDMILQNAATLKSNT